MLQKFNFKIFTSFIAIPLFSLLFFICISNSYAEINIPKLVNPVVDNARFLDQNTKAVLNESLLNLQRKYGIQLALLTIKSLKGQPIEQYAIAVTDKWQLGKKGEDKGVLFIISKSDRKMRIEVGRGLEGNLTDLMSKRITGSVKPYFKKGDYRSGIILGLQSIALIAGGKLEAMRSSRGGYRRSRRKKSPFVIIFWLVITFIGLFSRRRGGLGYIGAYGLGSLMSSGGSSYGSGGGFSGGGFSGGGGGFSGGGASDGW